MVCHPLLTEGGLLVDRFVYGGIYWLCIMSDTSLVIHKGTAGVLQCQPVGSDQENKLIQTRGCDIRVQM